MQSICWTTRYLSRALRSGFATLVEPHGARRPHFVSVACGFPKDFMRAKYKLGKFGEDAWFATQIGSADVIGELGVFCGWGELFGQQCEVVRMWCKIVCGAVS